MTWGDMTVTWADAEALWGGEQPVTLTFRGSRIVSVDIDTDATGTTVTARIEPD